MKDTKKNCIIAQSGGPTAVINLTAYGCIKEFMALNNFGKIYAGLYGIKGILEGKINNISLLSSDIIESLKYMPSAAFGSSRYRLKDYKVDDTEYKKLFEIFRKFEIGYFFYIGGNDSMDTANKICSYADLIGFDLRVCGIPKTIDNDLILTDHCPGFGSAAKFVITAGSEMWLDINTYKKPSVMIMEVMGRDTGWIATAMSVLQSISSGINLLIYVPERAFDLQSFMADVNNALVKKDKLIVVVAEGLKDKNGDYVGNYGKQTDSFGHQQLGGVGRLLQQCIRENILNEVRLTEFGILQRCSSHCVSETDKNEAEMVGRRSVWYAMNGYNGFMTALTRKKTETVYQCGTEPVKLNDVCNRVRYVPQEWIEKNGKCSNLQILKYMAPLIFDAAKQNNPINMKRLVNMDAFRISE